MFFLAVCCTTMARVASLPCSPGLVSLVVEDSAGASVLANATNCTGGEFDVEWMGYVEFPETIYVSAGTVLNITGADAGAVADGKNAIQFLNVAAGTVHLSGMRIERCVADYGGAVFANASSLTFNATEFVGNTATEEGGALYVDASNVSWSWGAALSANTASGEDGRGGAIYADMSSLRWSGETIFSDNIAAAGASVNGSAGGGAIYAVSSSVYWTGETSFSGNTANSTGVGSLSGGGAVVATESSVSWDGETSFSGNTADGESAFGGALALQSGSSASWSGGTTFSYNAVDGEVSVGGAVFMIESGVFWDGDTVFSNNTAICVDSSFGGAVYMTESTMSWSGETRFADNAAGGVFVTGGAVYMRYSNVSWSGETTFSNNFAAFLVNGSYDTAIGGAIYISFSNVSWSRETHFSGNAALSGIGVGGALGIYKSNVSWSAETSFSANRAFGHGGGGGALNSANSNVSWSAETSFLDNGSNSGGALDVESSSVYWSGKTTFWNNTVSSDGGALVLILGSTVSWEGETIFSENTAGSNGGALAVSNGSDVSWSAGTTFSFNTAFATFGVGDGGGGGACYVELSSVYWSGETTFSDNYSNSSGGALYIASSDVSSYDSRTSFSHNSALVDGGAVFVGLSLDAAGEVVSEPSTVDGFGGTFLNNVCSASGGALALVGEVYFSAWATVFEGNTAEASGGAVFVSDVGPGPVFVQANFTGNVSPQGGAVYSVSSGTQQVETEQLATTYDECVFTGNRASRTGGAVESVAGYDDFVNSTFEGGTAGAGGALRLGGTTSVVECDFVDNASDEDGGAAISNVGALFLDSTTTFAGNDFRCDDGTYLDSAGGDRMTKVCDGCGGCYGCAVEDANLVPVCSSQLEHTCSEGGDTTIETLEVNAGYWRATPTSPDVLACYNEDACLGGLTGSPGYCKEGYEGPCEFCTYCYML